jgi:proteasome lid subunit RPN8/RPN11
MMKRLQLTDAHWETMRQHVQTCSPAEGCGLLAGVGDSVREVFLIPNQEQNPTRFRMDTADQLRAFWAIENHRMELLGIFHSHPGDADSQSAPADEPSAADIQDASYPVVTVIWSRHAGEWRARGFWIEPGRVSDVLLDVVRCS